MVGGVIFLVVILLFVIFCTVMIPVSIKVRKRVLRSVGAQRLAILEHIHGLPEVGSTECNVFLKPESILIGDTISKQTFEIPIERVFKADHQTIKNGKFSVGKAVLGEALAGPIGAVIAGASGRTRHVLIIGYTTADHEEKDIAFVAKNDSQTRAMIALADYAKKKISSIRSVSMPLTKQL